MTLRIDHALVMDTDHLVGGGGYALVSVSPGVTAAERAFVSDNFGISGYLHDPPHELQVYFSFFRVPGGRHAFVRRFGKGRRRNNAQNRVFVQTLFLDEEAFSALHGLPWLIVDTKYRIGGGPETPFTLDVAPNTAPLDIDVEVSVEEAYARLRGRAQQLADGIAEISGGRSAEDVIASVVAAVGSGRPALLLQGRPYERLTLVAWSLLPPADRFHLSFTQHDSRNIAGVTFDVANTVDIGASSAVDHLPTESARLLVVMNFRSERDWKHLQAEAGRFELSVRDGGRLHSWLVWTEVLAEIVSEPLASDDVLRRRLRRLARATDPDRKEPWQDRLTLLKLLWSGITRAIEAGQSGSAAVKRWVTLVKDEIGDVIFREAPPRSWLDASEHEIGDDLLVDSFLRGTEDLPSAKATRGMIVSWVLDREAAGTSRVESRTLARLVEPLVADRSHQVKILVRTIVGRRDGIRALIEVLPATRPELFEVIVSATTLALENDRPEKLNAVQQLLLPHLAAHPQTKETLPWTVALPIAELLRDSPESFLAFAVRIPPDFVRELSIKVIDWYAQDRGKTRPLLRLMLDKIRERAYPATNSLALAFEAAAGGEPPGLWLPLLIEIARQFDGAGSAADRDHFVARVAELAAGRTIDDPGAQAIVNEFFELIHVGVPIGPSLRALLRFSTSAWARLGDDVGRAVLRLVRDRRQPMKEWEFALVGLVESEPASLRPSTAELLLLYWQWTDVNELVRVPQALVDALPKLNPHACDRIVERWIDRIKRLPDAPRVDAFLSRLGEILPWRLRWSLQREVSARRIEQGKGTVADLARLDEALFMSGSKGRDGKLDAAISRVARGERHPMHYAAKLLRIAIDDGTWPTTRLRIETELLDNALAKLDGPAWHGFVAALDTIDSIYERESLLLIIARRAGAIAKRDPDSVKKFVKQCRKHERRDALEAFSRGPRSRSLLEFLGGKVAHAGR